MRNQKIVDLFVDELQSNVNSDGTIPIEKAKEILKLSALCIENDCECMDDVENVLDKGRVFINYHAQLV